MLDQFWFSMTMTKTVSIGGSVAAGQLPVKDASRKAQADFIVSSVNPGERAVKAQGRRQNSQIDASRSALKQSYGENAR
jgi:hypothetical protein